MIESLDGEASGLGVTRQSIIKVWLAGRLEEAVAPTGPRPRIVWMSGMLVFFSLVMAIWLNIGGAWNLLFHTASPGPINSIAVLPFVNMSKGPDQEYFSDGISEELLNVLTQYPGLRVAARTSSFQFKGKTPAHAQLAIAVTLLSNGPTNYGDFTREEVAELWSSASGTDAGRYSRYVAICKQSGGAIVYEATRVRERGMRRFKSMRQAQRFVTAYATVSNLFNLGRHQVSAGHYRDLRISAFAEWGRAVA